MSAFYFDDVPTIRAKEKSMRDNFERYVREILDLCTNDAEMRSIKRFTGRNPRQWLRRRIVETCVSARSWAYDDGSCALGGEATEHALAMRQCLIVEMKIWLAAIRRYNKLTP